MKQTIAREEKERLIAAFKQSGLTTTAFAKKHGLNLGTFRKWLYKKPAKEVPAEDNYCLVEIETAKVRQCRDSQNIRILKDGMDILLPVNLEFPVLEKILGALKAI